MSKKQKKDSLFLHSLKNTYPAIKYNKKLIFMAIAFMTLIISSTVAFAAAKIPKTKPSDWKESPGLINQVTFSMVEDIFMGDDTATVAEQVKVTYDNTGSDIKIGGKNIENLGGIIKAVNDMCKGLALLFLIITFLLGLLSIREREQMDEEFIRRFIMFIFGMVCIYNAMTWCFAIANIGSQLAGKISAVGSGIQNTTNASVVSDLQSKIWDNTHIANYDHGSDGFAGGFDWIETFMGNFGMSVSYMTELIVPWLLLKASRLVVSVVIWGRALEVMIMSAFSPLGFAETPDSHNPVSGAGVHFIKNMVALSISGAVIVFSMFATNQIILNLFSGIVVGADTTFKQITDAVFSMVVVSFARVALVTRSQQIAKSVVGVL